MVDWRDREISALHPVLEPDVGRTVFFILLSGIPRCFHGIYLVERAAHGIFKPYFVKNKELSFRCKISCICNAGGVKVSFSFQGYLAGVA